MNIRESDLPGIGRKYHVETRAGDRMVVIIHDDGRREVYHFHHHDPEESLSMITMDDDEARAIAAIIGGMNYTPRALESIDVAFDDLSIEWVKVEKDAHYAGKQIGELHIRRRTGATIIAAVERNHRKQINPGPDYTIQAESTLIVVGERKQLKLFKQVLNGVDGMSE